MYSIESDKSKRLIVISASGHVSKEEVKAAAVKVGEIVKELAPGFRLVSDFRWMQSMDSAAAPHVGEIMDAVAAKHVASVIRIVPDPRKDIGLNILSQFHYGPETQIATFENLADALQSLLEEKAVEDQA